MKALVMDGYALPGTANRLSHSPRTASANAWHSYCSNSFSRAHEVGL